MSRTLVFTVTNDLSYDQRMIRICSTLANYENVLLVGRLFKNSLPLSPTPFQQKRIRNIFNRGVLGYAEYNLRLFFFLLFTRANTVCAIDLDTIIPVYFVSVLRRIKRIYDAHELFCEMKEVVTRPFIHRSWKFIEKIFVPRFKKGYTVNEPIAGEFFRMYKVRYEVIMNVPVLKDSDFGEKKKKFVLYQGAVNEGRCFETLIPAMKQVDANLIICGDGNFMREAKDLVRLHHLSDKIIFEGMIKPHELSDITKQAYLGLTLFDKAGMSNYYSLANRFFDYMHAGVPQVCVNYPVYASINSQHPFALLIDDTDENSIANAINKLLTDEKLYNDLTQNCFNARKLYNWQQEEKKLIEFYSGI